MPLCEIPPEYWDFKFWFRHLVRLEPGLSIGSPDSPYLLRWYVLPRNPLLNVYVHQFCRSDDDRALHDHPWWWLSLILKGGYWEHREGKFQHGSSWPAPPRFRQRGSVAIARADTAHRAELDTTDAGDEMPAWTLFVTGPKIREWGFKCPAGWKHWKQFTADNGCGEA